jgi:AAA domain
MEHEYEYWENAMQNGTSDYDQSIIDYLQEEVPGGPWEIFADDPNGHDSGHQIFGDIESALNFFKHHELNDHVISLFAGIKTKPSAKNINNVVNVVGWRSKTASKDPTTAAFTFVADTQAAPAHELIKNLLPAAGVVINGGQSSTGKTFLEIYKALCLATGIPFFGYKVNERVGTVFVAAEGRGALPNRFAAAFAHHGISSKQPIAWINQLPDFTSDTGIRLFIQQLRHADFEFQTKFGVRLGQFVIDTVAASFAMKSEDDNAEATKVCNILRGIGEEVECLASAVHHYGKNADSGLRGASAWRGSADVVLGALADIELNGHIENRELICSKARDGLQGSVSGFDLQYVSFGQDEDGDDYGSMVVIPAEGLRKRFSQPMNKPDRMLHEAIDAMWNSNKKQIVVDATKETHNAIKVEDLRKEFDARYVAHGETEKKRAHAKRMAFRRALD